MVVSPVETLRLCLVAPLSLLVLLHLLQHSQLFTVSEHAKGVTFCLLGAGEAS